jgi:very-short-patch-repair endonuclease
VIEVDGKQHYSDGEISSPSRYAEMVHADRELRLLGYEVYRFGGAELAGETGESLVREFFVRLFRKHGIQQEPLMTSPDE